MSGPSLLPAFGGKPAPAYCPFNTNPPAPAAEPYCPFNTNPAAPQQQASQNVRVAQMAQGVLASPQHQQNPTSTGPYNFFRNTDLAQQVSQPASAPTRVQWPAQLPPNPMPAPTQSPHFSFRHHGLLSQPAPGPVSAPTSTQWPWQNHRQIAPIPPQLHPASHVWSHQAPWGAPIAAPSYPPSFPFGPNAHPPILNSSVPVPRAAHPIPNFAELKAFQVPLPRNESRSVIFNGQCLQDLSEQECTELLFRHPTPYAFLVTQTNLLLFQNELYAVKISYTKGFEPKMVCTRELVLHLGTGKLRIKQPKLGEYIGPELETPYQVVLDAPPNRNDEKQQQAIAEFFGGNGQFWPEFFPQLWRLLVSTPNL